MEKKVVFLHIPKTGGTSLHKMLLPYFNKRRVCPERFNRIKNLSERELNCYDFFSGHFDRVSVERIPGVKQVVSMLRDPRSRIISSYKFVKAHSWEYIRSHDMQTMAKIKPLTFKEFLRDERFELHHSVDNLQVRMFLGKIGRITESREFVCPLDEVLDRAKAYLDGLTAYGILEYFDQTVPNIFSALELPKPRKCLKENTLDSVYKLSHIDNVVPDNFHIDQEDEENLGRLIWADKLLYNYAKSKFSLNT